jgi:hypothetical protein
MATWKHHSGWSLFFLGVALALAFSALVPGPWSSEARAAPGNSLLARVEALEEQRVADLVRIEVLEEQRQADLERIQKLESLLVHFSRDGNDITVKGANLHVVSGSGATDGAVNGFGNIIIGYNEKRTFSRNFRTGSHMLVVGRFHNYSSFGGIIVGISHAVTGEYGSVSGGASNAASGKYSSVSGGSTNLASGMSASISGGVTGEATGDGASISGGSGNLAGGDHSSISGGYQNHTRGTGDSISGGKGTSTSSGTQDEHPDTHTP